MTFNRNFFTEKIDATFVKESNVGYCSGYWTSCRDNHVHFQYRRKDDAARRKMMRESLERGREWKRGRGGEGGGDCPEANGARKSTYAPFRAPNRAFIAIWKMKQNDKTTLGSLVSRVKLECIVATASVSRITINPSGHSCIKGWSHIYRIYVY